MLWSLCTPGCQMSVNYDYKKVIMMILVFLFSFYVQKIKKLQRNVAFHITGKDILDKLSFLESVW